MNADDERDHDEERANRAELEREGLAELEDDDPAAVFGPPRRATIRREDLADVEPDPLSVIKATMAARENGLE